MVSATPIASFMACSEFVSERTNSSGESVKVK